MEQEDRFILKLEEIFAKHSESVSGITSSFLKELTLNINDIKKDVSDVKSDISSLKTDVKNLDERTKQTPIVNTAVFSFIGFIVVGTIGAMFAVCWNKLTGFFQSI